MALLAEDKAGLKRGAELRDGAALWGPAALGPPFPASPDASRTSGLIYRDHGVLSPMQTGNALLSLTLTIALHREEEKSVNTHDCKHRVGKVSIFLVIKGTQILLK